MQGVISRSTHDYVDACLGDSETEYLGNLGKE